MRFILAFTSLVAASPVWAQSNDEPICAERPGLGTPPCVTAPGRVIGELGVFSWTLARDEGERTDTIVTGDTLARIGIGDGAEVQFGWTAFGQMRERSAEGVDRTAGVGDVTLGVLKSLVDSDALAISVLGRATVPTGGEAIGAGDWSTSLLIPAEITLDDIFSIELTPSVSAAVDEDRRGRHADYGLVAGIGADFDTAFASIEIAVDRDLDPAGFQTPLALGLSGGWRPTPDLQLDGGVNLGLDDDADDLQLYVGLARRF